MNFESKPLTEEEESLIEKKINEYADSMAPSVPHTGEEQLVFKVENEKGSPASGKTLRS